MQFGVLGSLEVRRGEDLVGIGSANERKILVALLVDANAVVSTSRLIEVLWGDESPDSDRNAVQTYVARLRRRLATAGDPAPIVTRPPGYVIELRPQQLDALRFRELLDTARATLPADPTGALGTLDEALALWRGPALAEFADDEVARAEAASLEALRQVAVEARVDALLALGRDAEAVGVLEAVAVAQPLNERPHAQLMQALARCGRQVDALRLYQSFRERLADELGLEPSPSLRELEGQILGQAPHVTPAEPAPLFAPPAPTSSEGNLAPAITTFVGREDDVAELVELVTRARVVTLVGVGGVGKTRLAERVAGTVAATFPDGAWIVELARVSSPDAVPHSVAAALGIALPAGANLADALVEALRRRHMLLVVDNCEHVLDAAAHLVDVLARRCPDVSVVATSRERLGVAGEHVRPVLPLPLPPPSATVDIESSPAVALFVDRARAARAEFRLDETNTGAVVEICRGLDGVPLALEIAAARLGALTAHDLAQRLRDRFALLTTGPSGDGDRHRTLRALVDWSYGLLDDAERAAFDRLSVFAGGWTLPAAAAVCGPDATGESGVAALVAGLADKSMVVPPLQSGPARYRMLETLRLYGAERLEARRETQSTAEAHARYFVGLAEEAEREVRGPHESVWVARLREDLDNLRAAHTWCRSQPDADLALRLSVALHRFASWQANDEVLSWAEGAGDLPGAESHPLLPVVLGSAANRRATRGEMDVAAGLVERALAACDGADDVRRALPVEAVGGLHLLSGRLEDAFEHYREAVRLWRLARHDQGEVWCLCGAAVAVGKSGDLATAFALTKEAFDVAERAGNPTMMAVTRYAEGECLLEVDPVRALIPLEETLAFAEAAGNVFMEGLARVSITSLRGRHGEPHRALEMFADVIGRWRRAARWSTEWITLRNLVELLARLGAHEPSAVLYGACTASTTAPQLYGAEADRLDAVVEALVSSLGQDAFDAARARGAGFDEDEAVSFAAAVTRRLLADAQAEGASSR